MRLLMPAKSKKRKVTVRKKRRKPSALLQLAKVPALIVAAALIVVAGFSLSRGVNTGASPSAEPSASASITPIAEGDLYKTAVKIVWGVPKGGSLSWCAEGSGAQIIRSGLIITNRHVAEELDEEYECDPDASLWVLYLEDPKGENFTWYSATVLAVADRHDLALLEVDFEGSKLTPGWPVLQIAELADEPALGAPIRIFSYPSIGGNSITFTSGFVAGWARDQEAYEDDAVLKLDATISGGSSGSAVLDAFNRVVGVVMMGGVSTDGSIPGITCREWYDTNGDGSINSADTCQILGGFINGAVALAPLRAFLRSEDILP
jgi:S1-C subfamily serine protease